jgi:hypothetical protein
MKPENMKLLDLQTGKYLELGIDWGYYGEYIITIRSPFKFYKSEKYSVIESTCDKLAFHKAEPPLPLKEICEKVGAVVYGGRYVLFLDPAMGSAYNIKNEYRGEEFIDYKCKNGDFSSGYNIYNNDIITFLGNIFEEYSKQLRNELNKFDELKQYKI